MRNGGVREVTVVCVRVCVRVCARIDGPEPDNSHIVVRRMEGCRLEQREEYCSPLILAG